MDYRPDSGNLWVRLNLRTEDLLLYFLRFLNLDGDEEDERR